MTRISPASSRGVRSVAALSFAALMSASQLASAAQVTTRFEGSFADGAGYDISGCTWFRLVVGRTSIDATPQTFLSYDVYDVCGGWLLLASGTGTIPAPAFNVDGKKMVLAIAVTTTPTFQTTGATGSISFTFTPNGVEKRVSSGHVKLTYLNTVNMLHGSWAAETAKLSGTIINAVVSSAPGNIGETRDLQIQIVRGSK